MLKVYQKKIIDKIQKNRREERFVRNFVFAHFIKVRAIIVLKKISKKKNNSKKKRNLQIFFVTKLKL